VRSKFSCVRLFHGLCVRTHAHSLEGTLTGSECFSGEAARRMSTWLVS